MSYNYGSVSPQGVPFEEMEGSPTIEYARGKGISGKRIFRCDWSNYSKLAQELLGVIAFVAGAPVSATPLAFPGMEFLIVQDIQVGPFQPNSPDGNTNVDLLSRCNTYKNGVVLTVSYGPMDTSDNKQDVPDGTYLTVSADYGMDYITVPGSNWVTAEAGPGGLPLTGYSLGPDAPVGVRIPTRHYEFVWSLVVTPPDNTITDALGKVNNATFYGRAAETLLFNGIKTSKQFQFNDSNTLWTVTYTFSENTKGWNKLYVPVAGTFLKVKARNGVQGPPYPTTDFTKLFGYNG